MRAREEPWAWGICPFCKDEDRIGVFIKGSSGFLNSTPSDLYYCNECKRYSSERVLNTVLSFVYILIIIVMFSVIFGRVSAWVVEWFKGILYRALLGLALKSD